MGRGEQALFYANYMRLVDASSVSGQLRFPVGEPEHYRQALVLEAQTSEKHPLGFALGVEESGESAEANSLPGAPLAVLLDQTVVVGDVAKELAFGAGVDQIVGGDTGPVDELADSLGK